MKNIIKALAILTLLPMSVFAADASFVKTGGRDKTVVGTIANEAGLAYNRNYYLSPGDYGMGKVSVVINYSSVTFTNIVFSTADIVLATGQISETAHGMTNALPVLLTQTAGTLPTPLVDQTTYYIILVDANNVKLATTSAQAIAVDPIIFLSSTTDATQTYTLSALANSGNPTFAFYVSNDGTSYYNFSVSSTPATYAAGGRSWVYDFSEFNYDTLKLAVTSPTQGSVKFKAAVNMKR